MERNVYKTASVALVLVSVAIAVFLFQRTSGELVVVENVFFQAESNPLGSLLEFGNEKTFLVSPAFFEAHSINPYMANSMNLFIVVLNGNDRNAVQLIRVFDAEKRLKYCATNFGDELTQENLSPEDCQKFIDGSGDSVKVFIEFPNSSFPKPTVKIQGNTLAISTNNFSELGKTSFVALKIMFGNAEEILKKTNALVEELSLSLIHI